MENAKKAASGSKDGVTEPVPMDADEELDACFQDTADVEAFWEKHKGDKRAIVEALSAARLKRPRTAQL
eukprot:8607616-Pyramimonas_sp.AAC.1